MAAVQVVVSVVARAAPGAITLIGAPAANAVTYYDGPALEARVLDALHAAGRGEIPLDSHPGPSREL